MSNYSRRRFLTDLLFIGGAITAAAGLAWTAGSAEMDSPPPTSSASARPVVTPSTSPSPRLQPMPGEMPVQIVRPPTNPAGAPLPPQRFKPVPKKNTKP